MSGGHLHRLVYALVAVGGGVCACGENNEQGRLTDIDQPAGFQETAAETAPVDNLLTEERARLGRRLFFDQRLSRDSTVSCGSCHEQKNGFGDPRPVSQGVQGRLGKRNAPHLANLAWVRSGMFWDGRAVTLEEQAGKPIEDTLEMDLPLPEAVARVAADASYAKEFQTAYGGVPTSDSLRKALASFVRTLVSSNSLYDRFVKGDSAALTESQKRGLDLFFGSKAGCFHCHSENTLTNDGFFNNGSFVQGGDVGRQALTGRTGDLGKFRVPNLRNVEVTAPYMHDGFLATLEGVVEQYDRGGRGHSSTDVQIEPLGLTVIEKADLVNFMKAFTDQTFLTDPRYRAH